MTKNKPNYQTKYLDPIIRFIGSKTFFWLIIALFAFQATWIAVSFRYPLPYDEHYHFNLIKVFLYESDPLITEQHPDYDILRDLRYNGSLLYHYLMSFPYKLALLFTDSIEKQIVFLRILNIMAFTVGLYFYKRLMERLGSSSKITNVGLLFFTLIPLTSTLAAHINYDNLLFPITALFFWYVVNVFKEKYIGIASVTKLMTIGLAGSLIKFAFLPIFAAAFAVLLLVKIYSKTAFIRNDTKKASGQIYSQVGLFIIFIALLALFVTTYGTNVIKYRTPNPECVQTLDDERCLKNPIVRSYQELKQQNEKNPTAPVNDYAHTWVLLMIRSAHIVLFNLEDKEASAMESSPDSQNSAIEQNYHYYATYKDPLPVVYFMTHVLFVILCVFTLWGLGKGYKTNRESVVVAGLSLFYIFSIFLQNTAVYYEYKQPVAVQPRYVLLVLPIILILMLNIVNSTLRFSKQAKLAILLVVLALYLNGAGLVTLLMRSEDSWYWPHPEFITDINQRARGSLAPFIEEDYSGQLQEN